MDKPFLPPRIELIGPRPADPETVRLCRTEQDAVAASVALSGLGYRELAARMGLKKSIVNAWARGGRDIPRKRVRAFCNATGTLLLQQWQEFDRALREAAGRQRRRDRIAEIIAPTQRRAA